ncbi:hypothetical protein M406DRAFT_322648 [Cryphonectria parasitica EP155]|uniref:Uncharacterized protein n=1 Tax=Cryphonectria parasitica (strain ATCC 38755 / EP155) TaxID=660469 RepID=A0A9P5CNX2_CRYP1|nr:uncharacterized protein M406DRAFT_322648 [Cryphonectria parasitica EP155]KAF3764571.1 hypothetical protein M406DRAFT_322648 [Cryphonectria parasitica EP155]
MVAPIILLNGWPGVGKDTVAETLKILIGDDKASLVDWAKSESENFLPTFEDDVVAQKQRRDACFAEQVEHPTTLKKVAICTDCLPDTPEGRAIAQDFETVANRSKRILIPIYLECRLDENMRRISNSERRVSLKDKIRSPNEARTVRSEGGKLFMYEQYEGLTINTTTILPHEAALQILSFMRDSILRRDEALVNEETTPMEAKEPLWL